MSQVLARVPAEDRAALGGLLLVRIGSIQEQRQPAGSRGPELGTEEGMPAAPPETWHTIAQFGHRIALRDFGVTVVRELRISDAALNQAEGAAMLTVAHEIGHAVEKLPYTDRQFALYTVFRRRRAAHDAYNAALLEEQPAWALYERMWQERNGIHERLKAACAVQEEAVNQFNAARRVYSEAIDVFNAAGAAQQKALEAGVDAAGKAQAERLAAYEETRRKTDSVSLQLKKFDTAKYDPADRTLREKRAKTAECDAATRDLEAPLKEARDALAAVYSEDELRTHRLRHFVTLVGSEGIRADLTAYAAKEWPGKPQELFAEAYAFFLMDPGKLKAHSAALHAYFAGGHHRNDSP
ncbi:hypothetical protein [Streptomyces sp. SBT349]|uniref:hypothetical protein n=1 Tax=Streptomyces sp. SBT349 TaxID=1580539 RepID=UPI00131BCA0C|nr:hypothetical protein [Streptomyces sp. SBT349]